MSDEIHLAIQRLIDAGFTVEITGRDPSIPEPQSAGSEEPRDVSPKGLSFRSAARQAPGDAGKRGISFVSKARAMGPDDQEAGT